VPSRTTRSRRSRRSGGRIAIENLRGDAKIPDSKVPKLPISIDGLVTEDPGTKVTKISAT
jgi:hypothetical protein